MKEPFLEPLLRKLRMARIRRHILKDQVLVDIGCGWNARNLCFFSDTISQGYGIDGKVETRSYPRNIQTHVHRFEDLPWPIPNGCADRVTMLAVLEHIEPENLPAIFRGIRQVLKENGELILTVPTPRAKPILEFLAYKLGIVNPEEIRDHKVYYDRRLLEKTLRQFNFVIKDYRTFQLGCNSLCRAVPASFALEQKQGLEDPERWEQTSEAH